MKGGKMLERISRQKVLRFRPFFGDSLYIDIELTDDLVLPLIKSCTQKLRSIFGINFDEFTVQELRNNRAKDGQKLGKKLAKLVKTDKEIFLSYWSQFMLAISPRYLRISAAPADLLKISDNTCGWSTCHSFGRDYYQSNYLYCWDTITLVAYTHNNAGFVDGVPQKYWRVLAYIDPQDPVTFFAISRHYPDHIPFFEDLVAQKLGQIFGFVPVKTYGLFVFSVTRFGPYVDPVQFYARPNSERPRLDWDWNDCPYIQEIRAQIEEPEPEPICFNCGAPVGNIFHEHNGEIYCPQCFDDLFVTCANCYSIISGEEAKKISGRFYCVECLELERCELCGAPSDNLRNVEGKVLCRHCVEDHATSCDFCGELVFRANVIFSAGYYFCPECAKRHKTCEKCQKELATFNIDGSYLCYYCANNLNPVCHICGKPIHAERRYNFDGHLYCAHCLEKFHKIQLPLW